MTEAPRSARARLLLPLLPVAICAIAAVDLGRDFTLFGRSTGALILALGLGTLIVLARSRGVPHKRSNVFLLAGVVLALGVRTVALEILSRRSPAAWARVHDEDARRVASSVARRFERLVRAARADASRLAGRPSIRDAAARPDPTRVSRAFDELREQDLPSADPAGPPGVSLYDTTFRPLAWAGENHSLDVLFSTRRGASGSESAVIARGTETFLVVLQSIGEDAGFVSVEVPLSANRHIENRYLQDFDALSRWAGRSVSARFPSVPGDEDDLAEDLAPDGGPRWSTASPSEGRRLQFGLRSGGGELLGVASVAEEQLETSRIELRRGFGLACAVILAFALGLALLSFLEERPALLAALAAIWGFRWALRGVNLPLGMGLDLDNPADYASSLFFGLARSPIDFLITMAALVLSCLLLARLLPRDREPNRAAIVSFFVAPVSALALFVVVNQVVLDAWLNSNLALSDVSILSGDAPRLTVQLSLVALFVSATLAAWGIFAVAGAGRLRRNATAIALLVDGTVVAAAYGFLAPRGYGNHVLLGTIPLVAVHLVALHRARLRKTLADRGPELRWPAALAFVLLSVAVFYPSVARFEATTIRNFIEATVTPLVLQHGRLRISVLLDTARAIDRMYQEGALSDLASEDLAFRIWVSTDLSVSTLSSSVEVVDPSRRVVSRFALGFPIIDLDEEMTPAPPEWIPEERRFVSDDATSRPGFTTARRTFLGSDGKPWEIRIRVAADWRNLPFISSPDPYLQLFRTAAVENPLRFPDQELELTVLATDGTLVFQSVRGTPLPDDNALRAVQKGPVWWEHDHEGQTHVTYLISDEDYVYALSYAEKPLVTYAAELTRWGLASAVVFVIALAFVRTFAFVSGRSASAAEELITAVRSSFSAKLYVAFVLLALAPILSLAFLIRGIVIRDLERDVEQEGIDRAHVAEAIVRELHVAAPATNLGTAPVTDSVLERVAEAAGVDLDLYVGGELLATSNPELVASGLLHTRAAASAQQEIVVERRSHSIHRESVGSFEYLVVSVPIVLAPWKEPGILSLPLASRKSEIDRKAQSLNQTVLLAALGFSLAAAGLAYSLARRIAGPIRQLTDATHAVAEGHLDLSLETSSRDEVGALFASFNQMTADLARQRDELERSKKFEAWAEMARQIAHEVKNPLTPIQLATEHLRRVYRDPDVDFESVLRECSDTILQQVKTLRQISMEFSTFASPGPLALEPTDLTELVSDTLDPYRSNLPDEVRLEVEAAAPLPKVMADGRLLRRTLVNLVENSINALHAVDVRGARARDKRGEITVRLKPVTVSEHEFVEIVVTDDGVGIDPELRARVFEPYFSTRASGTGLGLAIARKVIEDHGGTIALESEPGRGTRVTIRLPAIPRNDSPRPLPLAT